MNKITPAIKGLLLGGLITLPTLLICILAAGGGHGTYLPAKLFFPITMLSTAVLKSITAPFAVIAAIQYPILGAILFVAKVQGKYKPYALNIGIIHAILSFSALIFSSHSFS